MHLLGWHHLPICDSPCGRGKGICDLGPLGGHEEFPGFLWFPTKICYLKFNCLDPFNNFNRGHISRSAMLSSSAPTHIVAYTFMSKLFPQWPNLSDQLPQPGTFHLNYRQKSHDLLAKRSTIVTWEILFLQNASETSRNNTSSWKSSSVSTNLASFHWPPIHWPESSDVTALKGTNGIPSIDWLRPGPCEGIGKEWTLLLFICARTLHNHPFKKKMMRIFNHGDNSWFQWIDFFFMLPEIFGCQIGWVLHFGPFATPGWRTLGAEAVQSLPRSALRSPSATDSTYYLYLWIN